MSNIMVINPYTFAVATTSAPSAVNIDDDDGTDRSVTLYVGVFDRGRFTPVGLIDVAHGAGTGTTFHAPLIGTRLNAFYIRAYGTSTGDAPTSWSWGVTETSGQGTDGSGGIYLSTGTTNTQNYVDQAFCRLNFSGMSSDGGLSVSLTGTNSGGSTAAPVVSFDIEIS